MAGNAELLSFVTSDQETLHGLLFRADASVHPDVALVMIHGVAMSFYTGPLPVFAEALAGRGHHAFSINCRGHDWIARGGDLTAFRGATYENFEECVLDVDAAIDRLKQEGYTRFVLVGHSLGSVKSLYYQGTRGATTSSGLSPVPRPSSSTPPAWGRIRSSRRAWRAPSAG